MLSTTGLDPGGQGEDILEMRANVLKLWQAIYFSLCSIGILREASQSASELLLRPDQITAWSGISVTCWPTAAQGWRLGCRVSMRMWPEIPTGKMAQAILHEPSSSPTKQMDVPTHLRGRGLGVPPIHFSVHALNPISSFLDLQSFCADSFPVAYKHHLYLSSYS